MWSWGRTVCLALILSGGGHLAPAAADNRLRLGDLYAERPTLENLGVKWYLAPDSDSNRNATATVRYREVGATEWSTGLDLLRSNGEIAGGNSTYPAWTVPNVFAGSVFNLSPGVTYEIELTLHDPNGILGPNGASLGVSHVHTFTQTTRPVPLAYDQGVHRHVYASGWDGPKEPNNYSSLAAAYAAAQPGDVILVHAGTYTGSHTLSKTATADRPIVIRAAGDGEVIFDGNGATTILQMSNAAHNHVEGITFRNATQGINARNNPNGTEGLVIRRNTFTDIAYPVYAPAVPNRDFYIADNTFHGSVEDWRNWNGGGNTNKAVWITGQGHVMAYNRADHWWDGFDLNQSGNQPSADPLRQNAAIDFYNNDFSELEDNAIETDTGVTNIRVYRNRIYNAFQALSAQPVYGGPVYFHHNVVYNNLRTPFKPNINPSGMLVFNNTFVTVTGAANFATGWSNSKFFNNLFIGQAEIFDDEHTKDSANNPGVLRTGSATPSTTEFDYNGYRDYVTQFFHKQMWAWWQGPGLEFPWAYYATFEAFRAGTGREAHGLASETLEQDFIHFVFPEGDDVPLPPGLDLRLREGALSIDKGKVLPNITDGYTGAAPDLGAYEFGQEEVHYGPRPDADSFIWTGDGGNGLWSRAANWNKVVGTSSRPTPDAAVDTAVLMTETPSSITLDRHATVGVLVHAGPANVELNGSDGATLRLRHASGLATISLLGPMGNLEVNAPVALESDLLVESAGGAQFARFHHAITEKDGNRAVTIGAGAFALLAAANQISGPLTVHGWLRADHHEALGAAPLTVKTGGVLENYAGELNVGADLTFEDGASYVWTADDVLHVAGALIGIPDGKWSLLFDGDTLAIDSYVIAHAASIDETILLGALLDPVLDAAGFTLEIQPHSGGGQQLVLHHVPEPAVGAALILAAGTGRPRRHDRR